MNYIKKLDSFGVVLNLNITKYDKQYKSVLGGIATIMVYITTLIYFIYKITLWQQGQLIPKVSSQQSLIDYFNVEFQNDFPIILSAISPTFDPFDPQNAVLICQLGYYYGLDYEQVGIVLPTKQMTNKESSSIMPTQLKMVLNVVNVSSSRPIDNYSPVLIIQLCDNETASQYNITCATEDQRASLSEKLRIFLFRIKTQQFNSETQQLDPVLKEIYLNLDYYAPGFYQLIYKTTFQQVDDNLFYQNFQTRTYLSDVTLITQPISQVLMYAQYQIPYGLGMAVFQLRIDSNSINQNIIYPKLGEILADIGSIMTSLLSVGILVCIVNNYLLEDELFYNVISYYFPDYKQYDITRNLLGNIKQVKLKGKIQDLPQFNKQYEDLKQRAQEKFTFNNQLYELSRIQFILMQIVNRQVLIDSHQMGIRLQQIDDDNQSYILQPKEQLILEDFNILSEQKFMINNKLNQDNLFVERHRESKISPI
ncbi:hypothetical protein pb186bvf_003418 [Paramecium bursaria]